MIFLAAWSCFFVKNDPLIGTKSISVVSIYWQQLLGINTCDEDQPVLIRNTSLLHECLTCFTLQVSMVTKCDSACFTVSAVYVTIKNDEQRDETKSMCLSVPELLQAG